MYTLTIACATVATMANSGVLLLALFALSSVQAGFILDRSGSSCTLNQQALEKMVGECLANDLPLAFEVMGHLRDPKSMASADFICQNPDAVVKLLKCMIDKLVGCFPSEEDVLKLYLPTQEVLSDALHFLCLNKKELLQTDCMDQNQMQQLFQCYMPKVMSIIKSTKLANAESADFKSLACGIIHSEEECIVNFHGSCTSSYVGLLIQFLEKFFPYCPASSVQVQPLKDKNNQPLKFQPRYSVINS